MTDTERERRAMDLFVALCDVPPSERARLLLERSDGDAALQARVEQFFAADAGASPGLRISDEHASNFLGRAVQEIQFGVDAARAADRQIAGDSIERPSGAYRIIRLIGEGGMGTVYEAEQANPKRRVAIKAIRGDLRSPQARRRFEYEAQVLARLEHPGIARLYDADTRSEDGRIRAYLAMEFIDGVPLNDYASGHRLDTRSKLELVLRICDAVGYAHRMGVIHRDLKPPNILVTADGSPKVVDFGVARATDDIIAGESGGGGSTLPLALTATGQIVGTLAYMAPEQLDGRADIDTRVDVYALGVILYQLLAGRPPIDVSNIGIASAAQRLLSESPPLLGVHDRRLRGDLEVICARTLEKDRARRYASVEQLAGDLRRFLDGRPIEARADSALYVLRKAAWRHRRLVGMAAAAAVGIIAFAVYASVQAENNRQLARTADAARNEAVLARANADTARLAAEASRSLAEQRAEDARRSSYVTYIGFGAAALTRGDPLALRRALDQCDPDLRRWEWGYLNRQADRSTHTFKGMDARLTSASLDSNHQIAAIGTIGSVCRVLDIVSGRTIQEIHPKTFYRAAVSPDGSKVVLGVGNAVTVFSTADGSILWTRQPAPTRVPTVIAPGACTAATFSPDGRVIAIVAEQGTLRVFEAASGDMMLEIPGPGSSTIGFSADSASLFRRTTSGVVERIDLAGKLVRAYSGMAQSTGVGGAIAADAASNWVASGDPEGRIVVWDVATGRERARFDGQWGAINALVFAPDGALLAACGDGSLRAFEISESWPRLRETYLGHTASAVAIAASTGADGRLVSICQDGSIRGWPYPLKPDEVELGSDSVRLGGFATSADGRRLYIGGGTTPELRVADLATLQTLAPLPVSAVAGVLAVDPTGRNIAMGGLDATVRIVDCLSGKELTRVPLKRSGLLDAVTKLTFSPDGRYVLAMGTTYLLEIIDVAAGKVVAGYQLTTRSVTAIQWHPNHGQFTITSSDGLLRNVSWPQMQTLGEVRIEGHHVTDIQISRDGRWMAVAMNSGPVHLRDARSLRVVREMAGYAGRISAVCFTPDGERVVAGCDDLVLRTWDTHSGAELLSLRGESAVAGIAFNWDGRVMATRTRSGRVKLWRGLPSRPMPPAADIATTVPATLPTTFDTGNDRSPATDSSDRPASRPATRRLILPDPRLRGLGK